MHTQAPNPRAPSGQFLVIKRNRATLDIEESEAVPRIEEARHLADNWHGEDTIAEIYDAAGLPVTR